MNRDQILHTAGSLINGDRARDYGDAAENFQRIADLWAPVLGIDVTATDVALCLTQLKVARLITSPAHSDSWVDAAGYIALGGEIAARSAAGDTTPLPAGATWSYDPAGQMSALRAAYSRISEPVYADPQGESVVRGTE